MGFQYLINQQLKQNCQFYFSELVPYKKPDRAFQKIEAICMPSKITRVDTNNAFLYQRINYRQQQDFKDNNSIDIQAVIDGQQYLDIQIQRKDGIQLESYFDNHEEIFEEQVEIQDPGYEKLCYDQMFNTTKEILKRLAFLRGNIYKYQNESQLFQDMLSFELQIYKTIQNKKIIQKQVLLNRLENQEIKSIYLSYSTYPSQENIKSDDKSLYCISCKQVCHRLCSQEKYFAQNQKLCRKLIDNRTKPYQDYKTQTMQIQCKSCLKSQKNCTLSAHQLVEINSQKYATIGKIEMLAHQNFNQFLEMKRKKNILRLEQTHEFNFKVLCLRQVDQIQNHFKLLSTQEVRLAKLNLQTRILQINTFCKQITLNFGEKYNQFLPYLLEVNKIYSEIDPPLNYFPNILQEIEYDSFIKYDNLDASLESPEIENESVSQGNQKNIAQYVLCNHIKRNQQYMEVNIRNQNLSLTHRQNNRQFQVSFGQEQFAPILQKDQK